MTSVLSLIQATLSGPSAPSLMWRAAQSSLSVAVTRSYMYLFALTVVLYLPNLWLCVLLENFAKLEWAWAESLLQ